MFAVVFFFVASRSLAESCGEICGGAGFAGGGSAVSVDAGRRGAAGRLPGAGGGAGDGTSGAGSSVVLTGGGVSGGGIGEVSSAGGVLTDGGAARTMCLFAHPARPAETAQSSARSWIFRIRDSSRRPRLDPGAGKTRTPSGEPAASRFKTSCRVQPPTRILLSHCVIVQF